MVLVSLVTKCLPKWLTISLFMPYGPSELLVIFAKFLHASMFLKRASSTPEKCFPPSLRRL